MTTPPPDHRPDDDGMPRATAFAAPGRADFLRAASAIAADDTEGLMAVIQSLSVLHPSAWQTTLLAGVGEYVQAVAALHDHDTERTIDFLNQAALEAIDTAERVADNPPDLGAE